MHSGKLQPEKGTGSGQDIKPEGMEKRKKKKMETRGKRGLFKTKIGHILHGNRRGGDHKPLLPIVGCRPGAEDRKAE